MNQALSRPHKLDALTSLRFFAAALIVIGHAHPLFGSFGIATAVPYSQGVSFFFVLSGFILAYNYPVLGGYDAVKKFWLARFARVWPIHAVMLLLWVALILNFDRQTHFPGINGLVKLGANAVLLQAWVPLKSWSLSFNEVAWSLSAEFFFYAVFPLLIFYWRNSWHWLLLAQAAVVVSTIAICSVFALPSADTHPGIGFASLMYFNPLVRLFEFSVGIATAFLVRKIASHQLELKKIQWFVIEMAAVFSCIFALLAAANFSGIQNIFGEATAYYFRRAGLWMVFSLIIGTFALSRGPITKMLSAGFMVWLGEISFALYMCHALVIYYVQPYEHIIPMAPVMTYVLFWIVIILLSSMLFYGVEQPARAAILRWPRGKSERQLRADSSRGISISWARSAVALSGLLGVVVSAVVFRPSMIDAVDEAGVSRFLHERGTYQLNGVATFDKRYRIVAYRARAVSENKVELQLLMRAEQDFFANDVVALHLNDENGAMFAAPGDVVVDKGATKTRAGTYWVQRFTTTRALYDQTKSLGMAMYKNSAVLFEVSGGEADWNGRRLVLPVVSVGTAVAATP